LATRCGRITFAPFAITTTKGFQMLSARKRLWMALSGRTQLEVINSTIEQPALHRTEQPSQET